MQVQTEEELLQVPWYVVIGFYILEESGNMNDDSSVVF